MQYKTTWTRKEDVTREWYIVDVKDQILGRAATQIASLIIGKAKVEAVPNVDCGDYVIVLNSDEVKLTRGKEKKKFYFKHTTYPGGATFTRFDEQMKKDSTKVIKDAVKNMLPKNKLRDGRMTRLFIYAGSEHKNGAQKPTEFKL